MKIIKDIMGKLIIEYSPQNSIKVYILFEFILIVYSFMFISYGYQAWALYVPTLLFPIYLLSKIKFIHCIFDKKKNFASISSRNIFGQYNSRILKIEDIKGAELTSHKIVIFNIYELNLKTRANNSISLTPGFVYLTEDPNNVLIKINDFFGFESSLQHKKKYKDFRLIFLFILSMPVFMYSLYYPGKALIDAVDRGDIVTVRNYLESGYNPNPSNFFESNPLFLAADRGQEEIVELLLEKGAKVNVYSMESTPLHQAVAAKNLNIVKMLVEHGADINAIDKHNKKTPLDYAMFVNDPSIISYLKEHGAL